MRPSGFATTSAERSRCKEAATNGLSSGGEDGDGSRPALQGGARGEYKGTLAGIEADFQRDGDGLEAAAARSRLVDEFVKRLWDEEVHRHVRLGHGVAVAAIGGYGRGQLFPFSDVDLFFCVEKPAAERSRDAIRRVSQALWDCGMKVSLTVRPPGECERLAAANPEFGISLLDLRSITGDEAVYARLQDKAVARMRARDNKAIAVELAKLTRSRHARYGDTLFHLEPNIKDCPGGLRDANVCVWLRGLRASAKKAPELLGFKNQPAAGRLEDGDFEEAVRFLAAVRCFLHYRQQRDENTLDWQAQDAAAERGVGLPGEQGAVHPAYWMRVYFRHARVVERRLLWESEALNLRLSAPLAVRRMRVPAGGGFELRQGLIELAPATLDTARLEAARPERDDPAHDPEVVLAAFAAMAQSGARLGRASEERIADAIPSLSASLEEGPKLWRQLCTILTGEFAGKALRTMHALGVLELILPEFHGIDALVIRDAYHRYTVDEHTFVLIDTLHGLRADPGTGATEWRVKFGSMVRELQNPGLLYLAALLHDTGKARAGAQHAAESARLAESVLRRLEMDAYDSGLLIRLIEMHLEMSAALRRDIFDAETVRTFAGKVQTHEALRMLTLFTYADIAAVHPDALTPWKAENLWRLSMATANQLDRNVDEERVHARVAGGALGGWRKDEKIARVLALVPGRGAEVERFLEGFPERYVSTRSPETMLQHFEMTRHFAEEPFQMQFRHGASVSEITLVTHDRPRLFAGMAAALAGWAMNVVTADAFANASGVVVDSFRFTDTYRTLELNATERERFVASVRELVAGRSSVETLLSGRRRGRRKAPRMLVETKVEFDAAASSHSTLLQVIAQDVPGLLRAISATLSEHGLNVEVALVDTEGEMAIDVFYLTSGGEQLRGDQEAALREALLTAIAANAAA